MYQDPCDSYNFAHGFSDEDLASPRSDSGVWGSSGGAWFL